MTRRSLWLCPSPAPLLAALALSALSCDNGPAVRTESPASKQPPAGKQVFSDWRRVVEVRIAGDRRVATPRGFREHRRTLYDENGGTFQVYGMKDPAKPVGFYLPNGKTFRYRLDERGEVVTEEVGTLLPETAVRTLLEIEGEIEFDTALGTP